MNKQTVVTAFVQLDDKVLLLRRGGEAVTYPDRWSAVSGFVERDESLLDAAYREIQEEVGLNRSTLKLLTSASKLPVYDDRLKVLWIVNPFRFQTSSKSVGLNRENVEYRWATELELAKLQTVPKLLDAYHRTLQPPEPASFEREIGNFIERIRNDREHGAAWLASECLTAMKVASMKVDADSPEKFALKLTSIGRAFMHCRPTLAGIPNLVGQFLLALQEKSMELELMPLRSWAASYAIELQNTSRDALKKIAVEGAKLIDRDSRIVTHSYSSTVRETLLNCARSGRTLQVCVTESLPLGEGRRLATELNEGGVSASIIPDSAAAETAKTCDTVIVGADSILADGSLINKVGTLHLALAAKHFGVGFYSLAETTKFALNSLTGDTPRVETFVDDRGRELPLFDMTPPECVKSFITEVGPLSCSEIELRMCERLQRTYL